MDSQSSNSSQGSQDSTLTITDEYRREILYFAYGSNMSTEQMRERCPTATAVGLAKTVGWRWIINRRGYANIVRVIGGEELYAGREEEEDDEDEDDGKDGEDGEEKGGKGKGRVVDKGGDGEEDDDEIYGMLYLLSTEDEERLDQCEGVPWAYEKLYLEAGWVSAVEIITYTDGSETRREEFMAVKALAYIDFRRTREGRPTEEYVARLEKGIEDARAWGMSEAYADRVMRRFWVDG